MDDKAKEAPLAILEATDEQRVPERVHLCPTAVHEIAKKLVNLYGTEFMPVVLNELLDSKIWFM